MKPCGFETLLYAFMTVSRNYDLISFENLKFFLELEASSLPLKPENM